MKSSTARNAPTEISNIYSLVKLFHKKYETQQYCSLLRHYIQNSSKLGPTSKGKQRRSKRRSTNRRFFCQNKIKVQTQIDDDGKRVLSDKIIKQPEIFTIQKHQKQPLKPELKKTQSKKVLLNQLPSIPEQANKCRVSRMVREEKEYICYSKKGRLLEPNKHSVAAQSNVFVIAEGSGKYGDEVSSFVSEFLLKSTKYLFSLEEFQSSKAEGFDLEKLKEYFKEMFESANFQLSISNIDIRRSGCTVSIVYMHEGKIVTASTKDPNVLLINKTEPKLLVNPKSSTPKPTINMATSILSTNQTHLQQRDKKKQSRQEQHFQGFGNIYSENCSCPVEVGVHSNTQYEFVMQGSHSLFSNMKGFEIAEVVYSSFDHSLVSKVKELAETTSKRMKTINHEDISCVLIKCSMFK